MTVRHGAISGFFTGIAPTSRSEPGPGDRFVGLTIASGGYGISAGSHAVIAFIRITTTAEAGIGTLGDQDTVVHNTAPVINSSGNGDRIEGNDARDLAFAGNDEVISHNRLSGIIVSAEVGAWRHERLVVNTAVSIQLHGVRNSLVIGNTVTGRGVPACGAPSSNQLCNGIDVREGVLNIANHVKEGRAALNFSQWHTSAEPRVVPGWHGTSGSGGLHLTNRSSVRNRPATRGRRDRPRAATEPRTATRVSSSVGPI